MLRERARGNWFGDNGVSQCGGIMMLYSAVSCVAPPQDQPQKQSETHQSACVKLGRDFQRVQAEPRVRELRVFEATRRIFICPQAGRSPCPSGHGHAMQRPVSTNLVWNVPGSLVRDFASVTSSTYPSCRKCLIHARDGPWSGAPDLMWGQLCIASH